MAATAGLERDDVPHCLTRYRTLRSGCLGALPGRGCFSRGSGQQPVGCAKNNRNQLPDLGPFVLLRLDGELFSETLLLNERSEVNGWFEAADGGITQRRAACRLTVFEFSGATRRRGLGDWHLPLTTTGD